jgi:hypothetical protein
MLAPRAWLFVAAVTLSVAAGGCSSSGFRDQYYGTDVGANWVPPDGGLLSHDAASDGEAGAAADAADGGADAADGGADALDANSADAPTGETL